MKKCLGCEVDAHCDGCDMQCDWECTVETDINSERGEIESE